MAERSLELVAGAASAFTDENGVAMIVFAEHSVRDGWTLEIQHPGEVDEQDVALGMDVPCLVWNGSAFYGAVESWGIDADGVRLSLRGEVVSELGVDHVTVSTARDEAIAAALHHILGAA